MGLSIKFAQLEKPASNNAWVILHSAVESETDPIQCS